MQWAPFWRLTLAFLSLHAALFAQSSWEAKNQAGERAFQEGRLLEASRLFNDALQDARQFGPNDVRLAPVYNNLALVFFVQNDFIDSETYYEQALKVMQPQGQENSLLLPVLDNLTGLYVKQWAFGKAIQTSSRACHIREKQFGPANLQTADGLNKLATLYLDSVRLLPQSPSSQSPAAGAAQGDPAQSSSLCDLPGLSPSDQSSALLDDSTKLAIAEYLFGKVLKLREKAYGSESTRLLDVLQNLAEVRRAQGKTSAAEETNARTISLLEKAFTPDDFRLSTPLLQMAQLKAEEASNDEADGFYQRWLRIVEHKPGAADPSLVAGLTGYADLLDEMGKTEQAKTYRNRVASAVPAAPKTTAASASESVPYILRFEQAIYDQHAGDRLTCVLIRADGRFRTEELQRERGAGPAIVPRQKVPDGMPDMTGLGPQDNLNTASQPGSHPPRIFEGTLDAGALQQLDAILSAKEIRVLQGGYPGRKDATSFSTEKIAVSILREDGVQNFAFPDTSARHPYEGSLKPLFKWVSNAEKHKGSVVPGAATNCSPDMPETNRPPRISPRASRRR